MLRLERLFRAISPCISRAPSPCSFWPQVPSPSCGSAWSWAPLHGHDRLRRKMCREKGERSTDPAWCSCGLVRELANVHLVDLSVLPVPAVGDTGPAQSQDWCRCALVHVRRCVCCHGTQATAQNNTATCLESGVTELPAPVWKWGGSHGVAETSHILCACTGRTTTWTPCSTSKSHDTSATRGQLLPSHLERILSCINCLSGFLPKRFSYIGPCSSWSEHIWDWDVGLGC